MQEGRKAPLCQVQFRVKGRADWRIPRVEVGCGNTNLLRKNDFVKVAPGASIDLLGGMDWSVLALQHVADQPGWYEFRLVYDTTAPLQRWLGGPIPDSEVERMAIEFKPFHEQVPIGRFVSSVALVRLIRRP